jgi:hypothetical protein
LFVLRRRVHFVWLFARDLLEHGLHEQEDPGVALDEVFEFHNHRVQLLWVIVDVLDHAAQPFSLRAVVAGHPVADPVTTG